MNQKMSLHTFEAVSPDVFKKYMMYKQYYLCKTNRKEEVYSSDYNSVLFKSLMAFFMYQEKKKNKHLTLKTIANILDYKSHTGVLYAIKNIKNLLLYQSKYKIKDKDIKKYFLILNGISCNIVNKT